MLVKNIVLTAAASLVALFFDACASRHDQRHHHQQHTAEPLDIKIPDRAAGIFAETQKHLEALSASIKSKDQRAVHHHDVAIREVIGRVPQRATSDTKLDVDRLVSEIAESSKSAHRAAHDEDWTKAEANVKRAQDSLAELQGRFKEIPH